MDMFVGGYSPPVPDPQDDVKDASLTRADGVTTLRFKRKIDTGDKMDFSLGEGVHMMFPYSGGRMVSGQFIGKHTNVPFVQGEKTTFTKGKKEITDRN